MGQSSGPALDAPRDGGSFAGDVFLFAAECVLRQSSVDLDPRSIPFRFGKLSDQNQKFLILGGGGGLGAGRNLIRGCDWFGALPQPQRIASAVGGRLAKEFISKRPCCHRPGLARELREDEGLDLGSPQVRTLIGAWALSVTLSISDTERQHATNKRSSAAPLLL